MSAPNYNPPNGSGWKVTGQQEGVQVDATGHVVTGVTVSFLTGHGVTGTVFLPDAQYTPDNVRNAVQAKSAILDAVTGLSSEV